MFGRFICQLEFIGLFVFKMDVSREAVFHHGQQIQSRTLSSRITLELKKCVKYCTRLSWCQTGVGMLLRPLKHLLTYLPIE